MDLVDHNLPLGNDSYRCPQNRYMPEKLLGGIHVGMCYRSGAEGMFGELIWA